MMKMLATIVCFLSLAAFVGCTKDASTDKADDHAHDHDDHDHGDEMAGGDHGPMIELGASTLGDWSVRASRDQGDLAPGGEAAIDAWITGGTGTIVAVRFWIGTEDAAGSIKARAEIENPAHPNHWHTHVELPDPLPADARVWVEVELEGGAKSAASFPLTIG